jgi:tetratricopeptide (TPR) repeat protein
MKATLLGQSSDRAQADNTLYRQAVESMAKRRFPHTLRLVHKILRNRRLLPDRRASVYYLRADALMDMGRFKEAIHAYSKGIQYRFEIDAMLGRAHARFYLRRYRAALRDYQTVIKNDPSHAIALRGAGDALLKLRRFKQALKMMKHALASKPNYSAARATLEQLLIYLK